MNIQTFKEKLFKSFKKNIQVNIEELLLNGKSIDNKIGILKSIDDFLEDVFSNKLTVDEKNKIKLEIFENSIPIALTELEASDFEGKDALTIEELINNAINNIVNDVLNGSISHLSIEK